MQGNPLPITLTGKVEGETMSGQGRLRRLRRRGLVSAKRATATASTRLPRRRPPATSSAPAAGSTPAASNGRERQVEIVLKTGGGEFPVRATLTDTPARSRGTLTTQMGEVAGHRHD